MSKIKYWLPSILYMALIFYLSSHPSPEVARRFPIIAQLKVIHMIEYGILYLLFWWAFIRTTTYSKLEAFSLAFTMTVLYGLSDEFHQIFVPERTARLLDVVADGIGAVIVQAGIAISGKSRR